MISTENVYAYASHIIQIEHAVFMYTATIKESEQEQGGATCMFGREKGRRNDVIIL